MFHCSIDTIDRIENGLNKCMSVDMAVLMADKYNAPHLLNHYCLNECPIGCRQSLSEDVLSIERVTVKLLKGLRVDQLSDIKDKLVDIAADGVITDNEKPEIKEIISYLDELAKTVSELKIIGQIALNGGNDD